MPVCEVDDNLEPILVGSYPNSPDILTPHSAKSHFESDYFDEESSSSTGLFGRSVVVRDSDSHIVAGFNKVSVD